MLFRSPKIGFIWLAIKGRLGTQDRLHLDSHNLKCLLCNRCMETHEHLFFQCSFSRQVWDFISLKCNIKPTVLSWEARITQMVRLCAGNSLTSSIRKLSLLQLSIASGMKETGVSMKVAKGKRRSSSEESRT